MPGSSIAGAVIVLRPEDNVAVAAYRLPKGASIGVNGHSVTTLEPIQQGHKLALALIRKGDAIRKYGQVIGFASQDIEPGDWVHTHNVAVEKFERDYAFCSECPADPQSDESRFFMGYERADGRVGTRNYICLVSTVNCSATTCRAVAERFRNDGLRDFPNVDGVFAITHKSGCGMQYGGPDHEQLDRTLAGFAKHPNVGAYVLVGLGCETGQASHIVEGQDLVQIALPGQMRASTSTPPRRPTIITIQECGGIPKTIDTLTKLIRDMLPGVNDVRRTRQPSSKIILGTNCGGSDGNSGITANPALGIASDLLVAQGGTSILAETTEVYGAEHLLTRRAKSREIGQKLVDRIKWWEWYTAVFGADINNNPSVGNKEGGLTTIYEKSLGAVAKGGSAPLSGVFLFAERVNVPGFVFMDTPGLDPVSVTGIVAGGANVVVFTTGRGSCFGCKPTPSIKVATNTPMYNHMIDDMDLNAGDILEGTAVSEKGQQIFEKILAVASGDKTKSELHGVGEEEFAPWPIGPTL
jgi:arabinonate dehydratase